MQGVCCRSSSGVHAHKKSQVSSFHNTANGIYVIYCAAEKGGNPMFFSPYNRT